jgi:signal peptidase II
MLAKFTGTGLKFMLVSLVIIIIDQITKQAIFSSLALYEDINILPVFDITHVHNYGAAFSFLSDAGGWQRHFFSIIAIVISVVLVFWMYKTPTNQKLVLWSYSLILGGAIGNVIDRLQHGFVIDFLYFYYNNAHFPAFNVADIAISCGAFLMILDAWFEHKNSQAIKQQEQ